MTHYPDRLIQEKVIMAFRILADTDIGVGAIESYLPKGIYFSSLSVAHMWLVIEYILQKMAGDDEGLVLSACEFWGVISRHENTCNEIVAPYLPQILPAIFVRYL